jgi:predicted MFS family arabinose efflux permease
MANVFHHAIDAGRRFAVEAAGGPARFQVIAILAATLGVDGADKGAVSAVSDQLKHAFGISNAGIGLLLAVVSFVGSAATLPIGILADRSRRKTILLVAISAWAVAMILSGMATSYLYLLLTRLMLGAVTAAAWPCVASMSGDFFPARERAGVYGLILSGELIGTGIGFFISGEVSSIVDWRWSFYTLAAPSLVLVWAIWRYLPEPQRGTQSWIRPGQRDAFAASQPAAANGRHRSSRDAPDRPTARQIASREDIEPRRNLVLHEDPARRSWMWAIGYLMRLPTYLLLIAASALVYYFFSGFRAFGMIFAAQHYGLSRSMISALVVVIGIGALIGVVAGGRISEFMLRRGRIDARIVLPGICLFAAVVFFAFGIWTTSIWIGVILLTLGAGSMAAAGAPIDAARLDIVHAAMWGRGESGRMALRSAFEGGAPLLFGAVSGWIGGDNSGLMWTFLLMLIPMLGASALAIPARRTYPRDVATAAGSMEETSKTTR